MSVAIIILGRIIAVIVRMFSNYESHTSWTSYHKAVANKLIFAYSLNSIVVLLVINLLTRKDLQFNIPGITIENEISLYDQEYGLANDLFYLLCTDMIVSPFNYRSCINDFAVLSR